MSRGRPRAVSAALGAALAWTGSRALATCPPGGAARWERSNFRGRPVSLRSGPALAVAVALSADLPLRAAAVASLGSAVVGAYDDSVRGRSVRGFRGHVGALRHGEITSGAVKIVGIGVAGLVAAALTGGRCRDVLVDAVVDGLVVAASANLLNLLDVRPGRALKTGAVAALILAQPGPAAAAAALLPADLGEQTMLGDAGANALGAVLGLALVHRHPGRGRAALAVLVAATAASEVVSYTTVIEAVPPLRWVDAVGRAP